MQLRDAAGRIVLEQAGRPANGTYPTTEWAIGEVLLDWHDLAIPADFPVSEYALVVVLRDAVTQVEIGQAPVTPVKIKVKD